ncbi:MAG TPA: hypothetical protein VFT57_18530 [Gemmatimonadaceae bacterium]|jgi:hypothetical protein|nr:hypothetical protein [Gemmatimonadaceae bacterium]
MRDAHFSLASALHVAHWGDMPAAPARARPIHDSSGFGTHQSDEDLRGFRPFEGDPPWRMSPPSGKRGALKIGTWALLALLAIIAFRMLMAQ